MMHPSRRQPNAKSALTQLQIGNRRFAAASTPCDLLSEPAPGPSQPAAAVLCSPNWPIPPDRLFGMAPGSLHVVQMDLGDCSTELLASLEWAIAFHDVHVVVTLGGSPEIDELLGVQLAPHQVSVVRGVLGPNNVVRFEPVSAASQPMSKSRSN